MRQWPVQTCVLVGWLLACGADDGASIPTGTTSDGGTDTGTATATTRGSTSSATRSTSSTGSTTDGSDASSGTGCVRPEQPSRYTGTIASFEDLLSLPDRHWATVIDSHPDQAEKPPDAWGDWDGQSSASYDSYQRVIGFRGLVAAWNSGVLGTLDDAPALLLFGGGHNDYGGNEVIAFDVESLSWSRLIDPTAFPNRAPDWVNPDDTPISRHTYAGLSWVDHRQQMFVLGGAPDSGPGGCGTPGTWLFDPSDGSWTQGSADGEPQTRCDDVSAYDPDTGRVLYFARSGSWSAYDPDADAWSFVRDGTASNQANAVIDPIRRRLLLVGGGEVQGLDLDDSQLAQTTLSPTGPTTIQDADDPGLAYDPVLDRIVGWAGGASVFTLDLETQTWEELTPAATNAVIPENTAAGGVFGRFRYVEPLNIYIVVDSTQTDVHIYRATPGTCTNG